MQLFPNCTQLPPLQIPTFHCSFKKKNFFFTVIHPTDVVSLCLHLMWNRLSGGGGAGDVVHYACHTCMNLTHVADQDHSSHSSCQKKILDMLLARNIVSSKFPPYFLGVYLIFLTPDKPLPHTFLGVLTRGGGGTTYQL